MEHGEEPASVQSHLRAGSDTDRDGGGDTGNAASKDPDAPLHHPARSIDEVLAAARSRLRRLSPAEADAARARGAVIVDIRTSEQRQEHGELPFALCIARTVLEWRLDPTSSAALPIASHDLEVVVICQEGYSSSLAAASLQDLGIHSATDVVGGHEAWVRWRAP